MTTKMDMEILGQVPIYFGLGIEIITAVILGGLIGYDREKKMKAAGIKTNILICLGATLYVALSLVNQKNAGGVADVNRTAAQVVSGIGFLGAGAIMQSRGTVIGMTTAATIWTCAAIGVTIGMGYPFVAGIFTLTVLVVLKLLGPIYRWLEREKEFKSYHLEVLTHGPIRQYVRQAILAEVNDIERIFEEVIDKEEDKRIINVYFDLHPRRIDELVAEIKKIIRVEKVKYHQVESFTPS